eukprot:3358789-Pyramimonas_sp.AAC.2
MIAPVGIVAIYARRNHCQIRTRTLINRSAVAIQGGRRRRWSRAIKQIATICGRRNNRIIRGLRRAV